MDRVWKVAVVGAGDLGRALAHYQGFALRGIEIVLIFDIDPKIIGTQVGALTVLPVDQMASEIKNMGVKIAILTVPGDVAQPTAERLVEAGVEAILNYAPVTLILPESIHVQHIDPVLHIQRLMYYLG